MDAAPGPVPPEAQERPWYADRPLIIVAFAVALGLLLAGYMFMGRGFAHIGIGPMYVGDVVLFLGVATAAVAWLRAGVRAPLNGTVVLLVAFMGVGAVRTIPYLGTYGLNALRDGVLWGYGTFALIVYLLADRRWLQTAARAYGWIVPAFAIWLPISWLIFSASQIGVDATRPGSNHPLVFFKAGDMTVHAVGAIAFLVLAPRLVDVLRSVLARFIVSLPLAWTLFITGATSRGSILAAATGLGAAALASRRPRPWGPVLAAVIVMVVAFSSSGIIGVDLLPSPVPIESATPTASASLEPSPSSGPSASPAPTTEPGRQFSTRQWFENIASIFGSSADGELDGTKAFRLAWWSAIVDYTVFGPYFWTGKGFGVNLADVDGFQPTADHSLRAPHNSNITVLARMGVPGAILWILLQAAFLIALLRAVWAHHRAGDRLLARIGAWVLVMWAAMMVVTSFDPYLEGPQGGIWYWVVLGLGLAVTKLTRRPAPA